MRQRGVRDERRKRAGLQPDEVVRGVDGHRLRREGLQGIARLPF